MRLKDVFISFLFFCLGIGTRLPYIEKLQSHWDGPQYSIAVIRYSLVQDTPSPPGYPLYIALARLFYTVTHDPLAAILLVSVLGAGCGAVIFYNAGKIIYNRSVGIISALLFLTGTSFYYFGLTAYAYGITPVLTTLCAVVIYQIVFRQKKYGILAGCVFALAIGFRPQEAFFLLPLYLFGLYYLSFQQKVFSLVVFALANLLWFVPFIHVVGGFAQYFKVSSAFANNGSLPQISLSYSANYDVFFLRIVRGFFLTFGISSIFLLYYLFPWVKRKKIKQYYKAIIFYLLWIFPCLVFNLFVRTDHAGYQMSYLSACVILIAFAIWKVNSRSRIRLILIMSSIVVFNLYWFFHNRDPQSKLPYSPTSFHYSEIRKNDIKLGGKISYIKKHFPASSTLIITSINPWRPLMYYLKDYKLYEIDALTLQDPRSRFVVRTADQWDYQLHKDMKYIVVPSGITRIVFTDDEAKNWDIPKVFQRYSLPGNSSITSVPTTPGTKYLFGFGQFKEYEKE